MNPLALVPLLIPALGLAWGIWILFRKGVLAKNPLQALAYLAIILLALLAIGWLVNAYLPQWVAQHLMTTQQSEDAPVIEQIDRDILTQPTGTSRSTTIVQPIPATTPVLVPTGQPSAQPAPSTEVEPAQPGERTHVVQAGENLYRISLQYEGVSMADIQARNHIADPNQIRVGQVLIIPSP